jgi:hypothetical protein
MRINPTILLLFCSISFVSQNLSWSQTTDSLEKHLNYNQRNNWITFDYDALNFTNHAGHGWQTYSSIRVGFGTEIIPAFALCIHLDYYVNTIANEGGFYGLRPRSAKRYDVAFYGGCLFLRLFELGCGVYHTTSNQVIEGYAGQTIGPWGPSGSSTVRLFLLGGIGYQFQFFDRIILPFGLYFRNSVYGDNDGSAGVIFRIGLGFKF